MYGLFLNMTFNKNKIVLHRVIRHFQILSFNDLVILYSVILQSSKLFMYCSYSSVTYKEILNWELAYLDCYPTIATSWLWYWISHLANLGSCVLMSKYNKTRIYKEPNKTLKIVQMLEIQRWLRKNCYTNQTCTAFYFIYFLSWTSFIKIKLSAWHIVFNY